MKGRQIDRSPAGVAVLVVVSAIIGRANADQRSSSPAGEVRTIALTGAIDRRNPFFRPLGRQFDTTCEQCHFESDAWSVTAEHLRQLFNTTQGQHPVFSPPSANDFHAALALGPGASLPDRRAAYSLMLDKGLSLVRRNFNPAAADFTLVAVVDPSLPAALRTIAIDADGTIVRNGTAGSTRAIAGADYFQYTAQDNAGTPQFWLHRRPLPTTNFRFLTTVGWDGQDTRQGANPATRSERDGVLDVSRNTIRGRETGASLAAIDGHPYTDAELTALATQMTDFMFNLITAQETLTGGISLSARGANGGALNLSKQAFHFGVNDTIQGDMTVSSAGQVTLKNVPFNPIVFNLFDGWLMDRDPAKASIERGQALFNAQRLMIADVGGLQGAQITLPDGSTITGPAGALRGSCSSCHDAPNVGSHSTRLPINIGISDKSPAGLGRDRLAGLPLFVLKRKSDGAIAQTTDPGRAVITGQFAHVGQFKGPILRGMSARPPFFHNGVAATLEAVVEFYDARFKANFTPQEKADLVAFLKAL